MTETYTGSLSDFFGGQDSDATGTALSAPTKKVYTGDLSNFFAGKPDNEEEEKIFIHPLI